MGASFGHKTSIAVKFGTFKPHHQIFRKKFIFSRNLKHLISRRYNTIFSITICDGYFFSIPCGCTIVRKLPCSYYFSTFSAAATCLGLANTLSIVIPCAKVISNNVFLSSIGCMNGAIG